MYIILDENINWGLKLESIELYRFLIWRPYAYGALASDQYRYYFLWLLHQKIIKYESYN